jgi:hypothetical protein
MGGQLTDSDRVAAPLPGLGGRLLFNRFSLFDLASFSSFLEFGYHFFLFGEINFSDLF